MEIGGPSDTRQNRLGVDGHTLHVLREKLVQRSSQFHRLSPVGGALLYGPCLEAKHSAADDDYAMNAAAEPMGGGHATLAALRRAGNSLLPPIN
jgi:hypothetical protein